jgi:hypothetical protein
MPWEIFAIIIVPNWAGKLNRHYHLRQQPASTRIYALNGRKRVSDDSDNLNLDYTTLIQQHLQPISTHTLNLICQGRETLETQAGLPIELSSLLLLTLSPNLFYRRSMLCMISIQSLLQLLEHKIYPAESVEGTKGIKKLKAHAEWIVSHERFTQGISLEER